MLNPINEIVLSEMLDTEYGMAISEPDGANISITAERAHAIWRTRLYRPGFYNLVLRRYNQWEHVLSDGSRFDLVDTLSGWALMFTPREKANAPAWTPWELLERAWRPTHREISFGPGRGSFVKLSSTESGRTQAA